MVVVTLGQRLQSDSLHSPLQERVDLGIQVFRETEASYLIFTGGQTNPAVLKAESEAMRDYAVAQGVPLDRILVDTNARDTKGNAYFTRRIVEDLGTDITRIYLVSSHVHSNRATYIFEQCFGDAYEIDATNFVDSDVPDELTQKRTEQLLRRERAFFKEVPTGDLEAFRQQLITNHDYYDWLANVPD